MQKSITRAIDGNNLHTIGQAWLADETGRKGDLPPEALMDVYALAAYLARTGATPDPRLWITRLDTVVAPSYQFPGSIVNPDDKSQLTDAFRAAPLAFAAALVPMMSKLPPETPVMWTRGLKPDGTWRIDSPYGSWGGHVVFANGTLKKFEGKIGGGLTKWGTHEPTSSIIEALPPGTRISEYVPLTEIAEHLRRQMLLVRLAQVGGLLLLAVICVATRWGRRNWGPLAATGLLLAVWFFLWDR